MCMYSAYTSISHHIPAYDVLWRHMTVYGGISGCQDSRWSGFMRLWGSFIQVHSGTCEYIPSGCSPVLFQLLQHPAGPVLARLKVESCRIAATERHTSSMTNNFIALFRLARAAAKAARRRRRRLGRWRRRRLCRWLSRHRALPVAAARLPWPAPSRPAPGRPAPGLSLQTASGWAHLRWLHSPAAVQTKGSWTDDCGRQPVKDCLCLPSCGCLVVSSDGAFAVKDALWRRRHCNKDRISDVSVADVSVVLCSSRKISNYWSTWQLQMKTVNLSWRNPLNWRSNQISSIISWSNRKSPKLSWGLCAWNIK